MNASALTGLLVAPIPRASIFVGKAVERPDSPQLRGMVHRVRHLITVEEAD